MLCACLLCTSCVFLLIQSLKEQLEANDSVLKISNENQNEPQTTIDGQATTEETLKQTVEMSCGQTDDVSTYQLEAVTINKLTEIPPAINITNLWPNTLVCSTHCISIIRDCVGIPISRSYALRITLVSNTFST
jgi:hypothetical protein